MSPFQQVTHRNLIRYACLAIPLAFAGLPIYMLAPDFYAVHMNLSLAVIGTGLLILRLADALLDPLIGRGIDFLAHHANLVSGLSVALLCLGFLMLFVPPSLDGNYLALWFFLSVFVVTVGFSALTILYGAVGALWSGERSRQTLITSYREAATLAGLILSVSLPFFLLEVMAARTAYVVLAALFVLLIGLFYRRYVSVQAAVISFGRKATLEQPEAQGSSTSSRAPISYLYFCYAISALASAVPAVLVVFFVRDYLGSQSFIAVALVIYFLAGALSMPVWHRLANRFGKLRAWQASMLLAICSFTWVCLLSPGDYVFYGIICAMSGAALGAEMALPPAVLSDYLQGARGRTAAQKYAGLTMISKLSLAVSVGVCLPLLGAYGFEPAASNQSGSLLILVVLYGVVPGLLKLVAVIAVQCWIHKEREISNDVDTKSFSNIRSLSDG